MLGQDMAYNRVPYFYTDQHELSMEYSGYVEPDGYDQVVFRGDTDKLEFIAFWLASGRMLAGMNVNVWDVTGSIAALVRQARRQDQPRRPRVPLETLLDNGPARATRHARYRLWTARSGTGRGLPP
jgi:3-phenylpropionate/trans-cinnamate dioxygenase ferredoxin reductase subunit